MARLTFAATSAHPHPAVLHSRQGAAPAAEARRAGWRNRSHKQLAPGYVSSPQPPSAAASDSFQGAHSRNKACVQVTCYSCAWRGLWRVLSHRQQLHELHLQNPALLVVGAPSTMCQLGTFAREWPWPCRGSPVRGALRHRQDRNP